MNINLYKFSKRTNSTKQPTGTGTQYACYLKEGTSVVNPTIILATTNNVFPDYNYAYIPTFGRYYFISDIVSDGNLWYISCITDVLATYKSAVSAATLYLTRCSSVWDGDIIDTFYPVKASYTTAVESDDSPWLYGSDDNIDIAAGSFIIGVVAEPESGGGGQYGSIKYYVLNQGGLYNLITALLSDNNISAGNGFNLTDASVGLQKIMISPLDFIKSVIWIPYKFTNWGNTPSTSALKVWNWSLSSIPHFVLYTDPPYVTHNEHIAITKHPDTSARGNYLNCEPFTKLSLIQPPFGMFELDTTLTCNASFVDTETLLDLITGLCTFDIYINGIRTHRVKTQVGVPIQLAQVYRDVVNGAIGTMSNFAMAGLSAMTGNMAGIAAGISGAIGSAVNAFKPNLSTMGGNGSFSELKGYQELYHVFYEPVDDDLQHVGRPLCADKTISTLNSGTFFIAREGDVAIAGTAGEQEQLKQFLESGVYYE